MRALFAFHIFATVADSTKVVFVGTFLSLKKSLHQSRCQASFWSGPPSPLLISLTSTVELVIQPSFPYLTTIISTCTPEEPLTPPSLIPFQGLYPALHGMPFTLGKEGAGVVVAAAKGETGAIKIGTKVAYVNVGGSYSEYLLVKEEDCVVVPGANCSLSKRSAVHGPPVLMVYCFCLSR